MKNVQQAKHPDQAWEADRAITTRSLKGGRHGETVAEMPDGSLRVSVPGFPGERFDVRLDGKSLVLRSLSRQQGRGYGYSRRLQLPSNAIATEITATHLKGSGIEIRIPTTAAELTMSANEGEFAESQDSKVHGTQKNNQKSRETLADRLNRRWDDPEGMLMEEDYLVKSDVNSDDSSLQIIEMDNHVSYAKDVDAVSGYLDLRGTWHSY